MAGEVATRYFRLKKASTYQYRSKASLKLYVFSGEEKVPVHDLRDQERFSHDTKMFVEVTSDGKIIDPRVAAGIPLAFSAKGMVPPKSYTKMQKAPSEKPVAPPPPPPAVEPARRTVSSAKTEEPAPAPAPAPPKAEPVADETPADAEVTASEEKSDPASKDSAPKKRKKRSRKKKSGSGNDK